MLMYVLHDMYVCHVCPFPPLHQVWLLGDPAEAPEVENKPPPENPLVVQALTPKESEESKAGDVADAIPTSISDAKDKLANKVSSWLNR
jgi:hypothetical protein